MSDASAISCSGDKLRTLASSSTPSARLCHSDCDLEGPYRAVHGALSVRPAIGG